MPWSQDKTELDAWSEAGRAAIHADLCLRILLYRQAITIKDEESLRHCIKTLEGFNRHGARKNGFE